MKVEKVIQVTCCPATKLLPLRYVAKTNCTHTTVAHNTHLTDSANARFAANACVRMLNNYPDNVANGVVYEILAAGVMPDSKSYVYFISAL